MEHDRKCVPAAGGRRPAVSVPYLRAEENVVGIGRPIAPSAVRTKPCGPSPCVPSLSLAHLVPKALTAQHVFFFFVQHIYISRPASTNTNYSILEFVRVVHQVSYR
jgi:hypothetical protein